MIFAKHPGYETFLIEKKNSSEILCLDKPVGVSVFVGKKKPISVGNSALLGAPQY